MTRQVRIDVARIQRRRNNTLVFISLRQFESKHDVSLYLDQINSITRTGVPYEFALVVKVTS